MKTLPWPSSSAIEENDGRVFEDSRSGLSVEIRTGHLPNASTPELPKMPSDQGIRGYMSVVGTLNFTYFKIKVIIFC
jgi:hypothetical protein